MKRNVSKLSAGPWCFSRSPKVDAITGNKRPVSRKDKRLQFPVFPTGFPQPNHVRAFHETAIASDRDQIQTKTFIDQEFHHALILLIRRSVVAFSFLTPSACPRVRYV